MQIVMNEKEQTRLIDMAKAEGVGSIKEFQMWLQEHMVMMLEMFNPDIFVEYGGDYE